MKKSKSAIIIMTILLIVVGLIGIINYNKTTLIQLSAQGSRQMMGYILKTHNDKIIVIDGGTTDDTENLITHINDMGGKVDYWFITHAHDDHAGAFTEVVEKTEIGIKNIYIALNSKEWYLENELSRSDFSEKLINVLEESRISNSVITPSVNDIIQIDNVNVEILKVNSPEIIENAGNEQSMVLKAFTNNTSILFLGDIGVEGSNWLIAKQRDKLKSDIVQMAHHGQDGATQELYKCINPKICLWPTPEWLWNNDNGNGYNSGNWLTLETRDWMHKLSIDKHYVSKEGDLSFDIK